jgi:hypothetical protein
MDNIPIFMTLLKKSIKQPNLTEKTKEWPNSALRVKLSAFISIANNLGEKSKSISKKL